MGREDLASYRHAGGYRAGAAGDDLVDAIDAAGLRGRGGAGFPTARKWRGVIGGNGPRHVVANAAESEPPSFKDRYLLRFRPHLVLDGLERCALATGADRAWLYVADPEARASVDAAVAERQLAVPLELHHSSGTYVGGEETAIVRALSGDGALPTAKPPRPFERGVDDCPTLVQNVETLANVPFIATHGPDAFRSLGTVETPGTLAVTLSVVGRSPVLLEVEAGTSIGRILAAAGITDTPTAFLMGGFAGGVLGPQARDLALSFESLAAVGTLLGCAAIVALTEHDCPVSVAADVLSFFAEQTARQCGACIRGTQSMRDVLHGISAGNAPPNDLERLKRWSTTLPGKGACGLLDAAALMVATLLREFPELTRAHLAASCSACERTPPGRGGDRFSITAQESQHEG